MARLPIPPQPVMPPEGVGPVTDPTASTEGDQLSPTTMVLNYLKQRGYQPSSENVRRALEANARDPGVIPGLRSDRPATDEEDRAAMAAAGGGRRGGSSFPSPVNLSWQTVQPYDSKTTSAPPDSQLAQDALLPAARFAVPNVPTPPVPNAPPTAGPPVVPSVPRTPIQIALDRATAPAGPELPQLPGPQATPQLPAPPEVPPVPARPAIAGPPVVPQIAAPPRQITGPPAPNEAPVAAVDEPIRLPGEPGPVPQGNPGARVVVRPKIAPGKQVQGAPIEQTPFTRALPRIAGGVAAGATKGPLGAILGGLSAAAPDIVPYIMKNLNLR